MNVLRRLLGLEARDRAQAEARVELAGADVLLDEAKRASSRASRQLEVLERRASIVRRREGPAA